ncbi:multicopper oxidase domain-containing protein [Terrabacter sp. BE26]|uniref:multicopper oxidase domain-containing protein n=1 Tax=Terrabacter sp. BE26 TaxID=2898152 RepID=UPI0035BE5000
MRAAADVVNAGLFVLNGSRTMIDGLVVPFVGFGSTADRLELPSGQLEVQTGDTINLTITNKSTLPTGFAVPAAPGFAGVATAPIAVGDTRMVTFTAPSSPGTHHYVGTVNGSVATGQALGATGPLVVLPRTAARTSVDALFPGVRTRARRQPLFGVGAPPALPALVVQERTWLFSELNPTTAYDLAGGRVSLPSDPEPEYFLINGLSGMLAVEDPFTNITGRAGGLGQPGDSTLVRMINTGRAPRSVHLHGNHFWVLSHPDTPWLIGAFKDTVRVPPASAVDVLVPLEAPPDSLPMVNRGQKYVVHDHIEMAETASGGHYPSGMVSEMNLT